MRVDIQKTLAVEEYLKRIQSHFFIKKCLLYIVQKMNQFLGAEIVLNVDEEKSELETIDPESARILQYLLQRKIISEFIINPYTFPDEPFQHTTFALPHGFGNHFFNSEKSIKKSLSEAVERYLWEESDVYYSGRQIQASYRELGKKNALAIFSLAGFAKEQIKKHKRLQFNEDTKFSWILADCLTQKRKKWCPTNLVSLHYENNSSEPRLRWSVTTGQATSPNITEARLKGLLEVIERDAFMISYLNKLTPPKVDLSYAQTQDPELATILKKCQRHKLEAHIVTLPTDFSAQVFLAVLIDRTGVGPAVTVGACASFDHYYAMQHALSEALAVRYSFRDKKDVPVSENLDKMHRTERLIFWSKNENQHKIDFLISGEEIAITKQEVTASHEELLEQLLSECTEKEYEVFCVEMSDRNLRKMGFRSVMLIVPEMQPMHLSESIPYLGGTRLHTLPQKLGYRVAQEFNTTPHPFP